MLDPKIIRDEPDRIKQMLKDRAAEFDFEKMLELDKKRRDMMFQTDELRQKRNQMSVKIGNEKKAGNDASESLQKMEEISKKIDQKFNFIRKMNLPMIVCMEMPLDDFILKKY